MIPDQLKYLKALIVDDEDYNRFTLVKLLENWNVDCSSVTNGADAIKAIENNHFNLVLMDLHMQGMDGIETAEIIHNLRPDIRIIIATAALASEEFSRSNLNSIHGYIAKPFSEEELLCEIEKVIDFKVLDDNSTRDNDIPEVNLENIRRLANNDETFFREMIEVFIRSTSEGIKQIEIALDNNDDEGVASFAHRIAASCKHMQASRIYEQLKQLENNKELSHDEMSSLAQQIKLSLITLHQYLNRVIFEK